MRLALSNPSTACAATTASSLVPSSLAASDSGAQVLTGIQIPPGQRADLDVFLEELGYRYVEETHNAAYEHFCD